MFDRDDVGGDDSDTEGHGEEPRRVALDALEAGVDAAHPRSVIAEDVTLDGETLRVADQTVDLSGYDELLVFGGGNAAGRVAAALHDRLGDRIDGGVVVT
ncbi:DUF4147 domain-containing protein, partial [Halorubrum sp. SD626R]|uniref:DUF4147 domain-containing protein n=3 Tax=Halorubrum TaxID=56688 RepID=UPI0010F7B9E3